ncbi:MAG: hypothetical protein ACFE9C_01240 [Candidatus Hodarchaeota archaeon]
MKINNKGEVNNHPTTKKIFQKFIELISLTQNLKRNETSKIPIDEQVLIKIIRFLSLFLSGVSKSSFDIPVLITAWLIRKRTKKMA